MCVLTALLQLVAGLTLLNRPAGSELLSTMDSAMRVRMLFPLGVAVFMYLGAAISIYLMRVEALACMGCLLARLLVRMVGTPLQFLTVLDVSFLFVLIYFAVRLFAQSNTHHLRTQSRWRRPLPMLWIGLTAGHLTVLLNELPAYPVLISTGSVSPVSALTALIGCGALYVGAFMMHSRPEWSKKLFLLAAFTMGASLHAWSYRYAFSAPFWSGVPIAMLGFGLARHSLNTTSVEG